VLTKVLLRVTPTFSTFVSVALWTVLEGFMSVSDVIEEMDLILLGEECSSNAMHGCISPSLVVKAALLIEKIKEFGVAFASP
jgi:hypothetical protein